MGTNSSKVKETPRERSSGTNIKPKVTTLPESATVLKPSPWVKNNTQKTTTHYQNNTNNETKSGERTGDNRKSNSDNNDGTTEEYIRQQNNNNTKLFTSNNIGDDLGDDIMKSIPAHENNNSPWRGKNMSHEVPTQEKGVLPRSMHGQDQRNPKLETYAQKHARAPYQHDEMRMYREKTIYRNPDEWEDSDEDENEEKTKKFDMSKFKEANKGTVSSVSGLGSNTVTPKTQDDFDMFFPESKQRTHLELPDYDPIEEDLIASIEKEYT